MRQRLPWIAFGAFSLVALLLSALPGTGDVNIWNGWVLRLNEHGFITGYNLGDGYLLHPPLGVLLIWLSHNVPAALGLPVFLWPAAGFTGFGICLWISLILTSLLVVWLSRSVWLGVLFQLSLLLNSVVYGYFDIWGVPFLLLSLHAFATGRSGLGLAWAVVAALIKWQFILLLPIVAIYVWHGGAVEASTPPARWWGRARAVLPATTILCATLLVFGPGTVLAFTRGIDSPELSGQALNVGWIMTWAMHIRWPESYGPLDDGLIAMVRTRDTRVMFVVRALFVATYGITLWRMWRGPHRVESLYRCMLAGYLAYFLFNKAAHENHLVPAVVVAGYLAWHAPRWRWHGVAIAVILNINMFAFYELMGQPRWEARRVWDVDYSLPLAVVAVVILGGIWMSLLYPRKLVNHGQPRRDGETGTPH